MGFKFFAERGRIECARRTALTRGNFGGNACRLPGYEAWRNQAEDVDRIPSAETTSSAEKIVDFFGTRQR